MAMSGSALYSLHNDTNDPGSFWISEEIEETFNSFKEDYKNVNKRYPMEIEQNRINHNDEDGLKHKLLQDLSIHGRWKEDLMTLYDHLIMNVDMPQEKELDNLDRDEKDAFVYDNAIFLKHLRSSKKEIRLMVRSITAAKTRIRKELHEHGYL